MKKNDGWINALFSLVFIAAPALLLFYFFLPSWNGKENMNYGGVWGIAIGFLAYVGLLSFLLIKFEWLTIESLNFNVPIALALMTILVTYPLALWVVAVITLVIVLFAFPINMLTTRIRENKIRELKRQR